MGQRRIPEDAGGERAGDAWAWACSGNHQGASAGCMDGLAVSRMVDWLSAGEMVNPTLCPPGFEQQSHSGADFGLKC